MCCSTARPDRPGVAMLFGLREARAQARPSCEAVFTDQRGMGWQQAPGSWEPAFPVGSLSPSSTRPPSVRPSIFAPPFFILAGLKFLRGVAFEFRDNNATNAGSWDLSFASDAPDRELRAGDNGRAWSRGCRSPMCHIPEVNFGWFNAVFAALCGVGLALALRTSRALFAGLVKKCNSKFFANRAHRQDPRLFSRFCVGISRHRLSFTALAEHLHSCIV